jgi:hypothetical protein
MQIQYIKGETMQKLTDLEYNVLMRAIEIANAEMDDNTFIDPYDNELEVTNSNAREALRTAENKIMAHYLN